MAHQINIRKIPFDFSEGIPPIWHPARHEWSHMVNGASLTMPYLEPFLNRNLREALAQIDDPDLVADVKGFIGQEAQHFGHHRRYNDMLKASGYPELTEVEASFEVDYRKLAKRSLSWRLAYCAGFETMTMGITEWLINDRDLLFRGADPTVTSFVLWHMVEETEHKSVAFDVYQACCGRYFLRLVGLIFGSMHVGLMSRRGYIAMLKKDGCWGSLSSRLRVWRMVVRFFFKAGAAMLRSLNPAYHPDKCSDPAWIDDWHAAYARHGEPVLPVLDTASDGIPPAFQAGRA